MYRGRVGMFDRIPQRGKLVKFRLGTIPKIHAWVHGHLALSRKIPLLAPIGVL